MLLLLWNTIMLDLERHHANIGSGEIYNERAPMKQRSLSNKDLTNEVLTL